MSLSTCPHAQSALALRCTCLHLQVRCGLLHDEHFLGLVVDGNASSHSDGNGGGAANAAGGAANLPVVPPMLPMLPVAEEVSEVAEADCATPSSTNHTACTYMASKSTLHHGRRLVPWPED